MLNNKTEATLPITEKHNFMLRYSVTQLAEQFYDIVYRYCLTRVGNPSDACDLTQSLFLKLCAMQDENGTLELSHPKAYIMQATVNTVREYFGHQTRQIESLYDEQGNAREIADEAFNFTENIAEHSVIERALAMLKLENPDQHEVLVLFYFCDMKIKEIAKVLHISENLVKSRLSRGRINLKSRLESEGII